MMEHVRREVVAFAIAGAISAGVLLLLGESWLLIMSTLNFAIAFRFVRIGARMCRADAGLSDHVARHRGGLRVAWLSQKIDGA